MGTLDFFTTFMFKAAIGRFPYTTTVKIATQSNETTTTRNTSVEPTFQMFHASMRTITIIIQMPWPLIPLARLPSIRNCIRTCTRQGQERQGLVSFEAIDGDVSAHEQQDQANACGDEYNGRN